MTKLHEILAVEGDREGIAKKIIDETQHVFKSKHMLFTGAEKTLKMLEEDMTNTAVEEAAQETIVMETTVADRIKYTEDSVINWLDVVFQKEVTNQSVAKADLVVEGRVLATGVPATFLLGLETKLKNLRNVYALVPTLAPGIVWEAAEEIGPGIYKSAKDDVRSKTQKRPQFRVLYDATDKHPAQIEKWAEDIVVGKFTTKLTSSMLPAAKKAELLGKMDKLIQAVKQARMRANSVEASKGKIAESLFGYLHD